MADLYAGRVAAAGGFGGSGPRRSGHRTGVRWDGLEPRRHGGCAGRADACWSRVRALGAGRLLEPGQPGGTRSAGAEHGPVAGHPPGSRGAVDRGGGRGRPAAGGQPGHAPRADDDPRGDDPRVRRSRPGPGGARPRRCGWPSCWVCGANLFLPWGVATRPRRRPWPSARSSFVRKVAVLGVVLAAGEVFMAKWRLFRVPELLAGSFLFGVLAVSVVLLPRMNRARVGRPTDREGVARVGRTVLAAALPRVRRPPVVVGPDAVAPAARRPHQPADRTRGAAGRAGRTAGHPRRGVELYVVAAGVLLLKAVCCPPCCAECSPTPARPGRPNRWSTFRRRCSRPRS